MPETNPAMFYFSFVSYCVPGFVAFSLESQISFLCYDSEVHLNLSQWHTRKLCPRIHVRRSWVFLTCGGYAHDAASLALGSDTKSKKNDFGPFTREKLAQRILVFPMLSFFFRSEDAL